MVDFPRLCQLDRPSLDEKAAAYKAAVRVESYVGVSGRASCGIIIPRITVQLRLFWPDSGRKVP